jgi:uncharacterized damage-inducible protein DinB
MMHDIPDLLEGLRRTPGILSEFVKSIPEDKLDLRRGEGFWTIAEHVVHLAQVQPMLLDRFNRLMTEDHPEFTPYFPAEEEGGPVIAERMSVVAALETFVQCRNQQHALLASASASIWQRTAVHPEYDRYSLYILARHTLMHDYWHMYRIEELWLTKDAYLTKL